MLDLLHACALCQVIIRHGPGLLHPGWAHSRQRAGLMLQMCRRAVAVGRSVRLGCQRWVGSGPEHHWCTAQCWRGPRPARGGRAAVRCVSMLYRCGCSPVALCWRLTHLNCPGLGAGVAVWTLLGPSEGAQPQQAAEGQAAPPTQPQPPSAGQSWQMQQQQKQQRQTSPRWAQQVATLPVMLASRLGFLPFQRQSVPKALPASSPPTGLPNSAASAAQPPPEAGSARSLYSDSPAQSWSPSLPPAARAQAPAASSSAGGVLWQRRQPAAAESPGLAGNSDALSPRAAPHSAQVDYAQQGLQAGSRVPQRPFRSQPREDFWASPGPASSSGAYSNGHITQQAGKRSHAEAQQQALSHGGLAAAAANEPWQEQLRQEHRAGGGSRHDQAQQAGAGSAPRPARSRKQPAGQASSNGSHARTEQPQPSASPGLWDNFESMDDDVITGVISAAQRAGFRRRAWDN